MITGLLCVAAWFAVITLATIALRRIGPRLHRMPVPDNQPGTNSADLQTCRQIAAETLASRKEKP